MDNARQLFTSKTKEIKPNEGMNIELQELTEGQEGYETAIPVSVKPNETQNEIENKLLKQLINKNWFLKEYWVNKKPTEQINIKVGEVKFAIYNFGVLLSEENKKEVELILSKFVSFGKEEIFSRVQSILIDNEQPLNPNTGEDGNGYSTNDGAVVLYPRALKPVEHRVVGVSNLEGTLIHELSHNFGTEFENEWRSHFNWTDLDVPELLPGGSYKYFKTDYSERCVTEYAKKDHKEDISESMVAFMKNPDILDSERFQFLKQKLLESKSEAEKVNLEIEVISMKEISFPVLKQPIKYRKQAAKKFSF